jgi:decaprenyl-phosphate phosphoribosyltransferase
MTSPAPSRTTSAVLPALVRACRPRQWVKNVLVLAAPAAGGALVTADGAARAAVAFLAFVLASASIYLVNDVIDAPLDRRHSTKRHRPIASGLVPGRLAVGTAVVLGMAAAALAWWCSSSYLIVIVTYLALSLAYCLRLKREPVIELFIVASGFLLRSIGGGLATGTALSTWFVLSAGFGSLFVAAGKRYAEIQRVEEGTLGETRPVLRAYTPSYLRFVWTLSASAVCLTYAQWALSRPDTEVGTWAIISIAPFLLALLRYAVDVDRGNGGEPEEIILRDPTLIALGAAWLVTVLLAFAL